MVVFTPWLLDLIVCVFVFTFDCLFGCWLYCGFVVCGFGFGCWIGCIANFWLPWGWMAGGWLVICRFMVVGGASLL